MAIRDQVVAGDYGYEIVMTITENDSGLNLDNATNIIFTATGRNTGEVVTGAAAYISANNFGYTVASGDFDTVDVYDVELSFVNTSPAWKITATFGTMKVIA